MECVAMNQIAKAKGENAQPIAKMMIAAITILMVISQVVTTTIADAK